MLVVCNTISKIVHLPGTYAVTFVDLLDFNEKIVVIWIQKRKKSRVARVVQLVAGCLA